MKKLLLIALIMVSVVVAGCTGNGDTSTTNTKTFVGGTQGIVMSFEESAPPTEIISKEGFNVVVVLTNKGEHKVAAGDYNLLLKGFSPREFGIEDSQLLNVTPNGVINDLEPAEINPDTGETINPYEVYVDIPSSGELKNIGDSVAGNMEYPMNVDLCYSYFTDAYGFLCIKRNLRDSTDDDTCIISGPKDLTNSGAPIQFRNLEEYSGGSEAIRFSFEVYDANAGSDISEWNTNCGESYSQKDYVYINIDTGIDGVLSCSGLSESTGEEDGNDGKADGLVKLNGGARKITCSQDIPPADKGDYVKSIYIYAKYDVHQTMGTKVLVKYIGED